MAQESRLAIVIDSRSAKQQVDQLRAGLGRLQGAGDDASESARGLGDAAKAAGSALAALGVGAVTREVLRLTDSFKSMQGSLALVSTSTANANESFQKLLAMANNTGSSLEATVSLYTRLANATRGAGFTQEQLLNVTDALNKAFVISGATMQEASNAAIQLSQGLASGTLRGEELNSVMEQGPRITRALAEYLGVTNGQIRQMAADGKITSDVVTNALLQSLSSLNSELDKMPRRFEQASAALKNNFLAAIGQINVDPVISSVDALASSLAQPEVVMGIQNIANALGSLVAVGGDGLKTVAENTDALMAITGAYAATVGVKLVSSLGLATQARLADFAATMQQANATRTAALADVQAAQINTRRALAEKQLTGANLARANVELLAARGTNAGTFALEAQTAAASANRAATITLTEAKIAQTAAETTLTATATRGAAARSAALAAFGGPVGLATLAVAGLVGGMLYLGSGTDAATKALIEQGLTLEDSIDKFKRLSAEQQRFQSAKWMEAQRDAAKEASGALEDYFVRAFDGLSSLGASGVESADSFKRMFEEVKSGQRSLDSLTAWVTNSTQISSVYRDELVRLGAEYSASSQKADDYARLLERSKTVSDSAASSIGTLAGAQKASSAAASGGAQAWEKYISQLTQTRDLVGANMAQEAAYTAAKAGFNSQQVKYARLVGEQTDLLKQYEEAVKDGKKADQERLRVQLTASITASEAIKTQMDGQGRAMKTMAENAESSAKRQVDAIQTVIDQTVRYAKGLSLVEKYESKQNLQGASLLTFGQAQPVAQSQPSTKTRTVAEMVQEVLDQIDGSTTEKTKTPTRQKGPSSKLNEAQTAFDNLYKAAQPAKFALQEYVERQSQLELLLSKGKITQQQYNEALAQSSINYAAAIKGAQGLTQAEQYRAQMERQLATQRMEYAAQAEGVGMGQKDAARMQDRLRIEQDTNNRILQLQTELANAQGEKQRQDLQAQIDIEREFLQKRVAAQREGWSQIDQAQADWSNGARGAFQDYMDSARDVAGQTRNLFSNAFGNMEDAVVNFVKTGKLSFKDFADQVVADLIRIQVRQAAAGFLSTAFSAAAGYFGGGGASGFAAGSAGAASSKLGASAAGYSPRYGFSGGGYTGDGGKFEPKGVVHGGEYVVRKEVVSQPGMRDHLDRLNKKGYASGGAVEGGAPSIGSKSSSPLNLPVIEQHFHFQGSPDQAMVEQLRQAADDGAKRGARGGYDMVLRDLKQNGAVMQLIRRNR